MVIDVYTRYLAPLHHMSEPYIILLFHINPHTNTHFALYIYMYIHCLCSNRLLWYLPMSLLPSRPLHGKSHANVFSVVCLIKIPLIFHLRSFIISVIVSQQASFDLWSDTQYLRLFTYSYFVFHSDLCCISLSIMKSNDFKFTDILKYFVQIYCI